MAKTPTTTSVIISNLAYPHTKKGKGGVEGALPPCVLALLVEVSTLERGGRGQLPAGHSLMQHPVATPPSSPPLLGSRFPRLLLLRLRRHHPHRSRSSSPELSHPSNWPSSGGASPMA
jgi:hypothetical protein